MKIAAYVDQSGHVTGLFSPGSLRVYQSQGDAWAEIGAFALTVDPAQGLGAMKARLRELCALPELQDCRVLLAEGLTGILPTLLESFGFHCWSSDGYAKALLDEIAGQERARAEAEAAAQAEACASAEACGTSTGNGSGGCGGGCGGGGTSRPIGLGLPTLPEPEALGGGRFHLDLAAALAGGDGLNSRDILLPFLHRGGFERLDLDCDHLPRWFGPTLAELGLTATTEAAGAGLHVVVRPRPGAERPA